MPPRHGGRRRAKQSRDARVPEVNESAEDDLEDDIASDNVEKQPKSGGTKKNMWVPHISREEALEGVRNGIYLQGNLFVHSKQTSVAHVKVQGREGDIAVLGRYNRNRAIHDDIVVVQLKEFEKPNTTEDVDKEDGSNPDESDDEVVDGALLRAQNVGEKPSTSSTQKNRPSKESARLDQMDEIGMEDRHADQVKGSVVCIVDFKGRNKGFVCTMKPRKQDEEEVVATDVVVRAVPLFARFPWVIIQLTDDIKKMLAVPGIIDRYEQYFCRIVQWNDTSNLPLGKIEGSALGRAGTVDGEVNACIYEHGLKSHMDDFSENIYDHVDNIVDEVQQNFEVEAQKREDLRGGRIRVFTIDPATAKDLDDAIHIEKVEPNVIEVGVHIADVSQFVKPLSSVDNEAQMRTTSVYMPDRVLPMLPHALCNFLCSLNPHEDKLTFSVFYRIDATTGALFIDGPNKPRFAKTVVRSCCRLNYEEAQEILDNPEMEPLPVSGNFTWSQIVQDMITIYDVCSKTRKHRFDKGGFTLNKAKMVFHIRGTADGIPTDYHIEKHSPSHWIIEELMLMANKSVARFLALSSLQDVACLRNHAYPNQEAASELSTKLHDCNISWDAKSSKALAKSLRDIETKYGEFIARTIEVLVMQCGMKPAKYFIVNTVDESSDSPVEHHPFHYALNFDYYTHFTSPIRRYPDIMVHRCLQAILENRTAQEHASDYSAPADLTDDTALLADNDEDEEDDVGEDPAIRARKKLWSTKAHQKLVKLCETSNEKKKMHKDASEMCDRAFFCLYLRGLKQTWFTNVALIGATEKYVRVYAHQLGKEKNIEYLKECPRDFGLDLQVPVLTRMINSAHLKIYWRRPGTEKTRVESVQSEAEAENTAEDSEKEDDAENEADEEDVDYENTLKQDPTVVCKDVLLLGAVPVAIVPLDSVPIDYTMLFLSPFHPKYDEIDLGEKGAGFHLHGAFRGDDSDVE